MIYCAQEYSFKEGKYIYKYNVAQKKKTEERNEGKGREREERSRKRKKCNLWNVKKKCLALSASMEKSIIFHTC